MLKYLLFFYTYTIVSKNLVDGIIITNYNGKVAGDRTLEECVHGYEPTLMDTNNTRMFITTSQLAQELGYPSEEHVVKTDDGYILTLHRIPGKAGAPVVFLQHGLLGSSFDWVILGKEKALAFKLADQGYDVWMGNMRGNTYSRCHITHKPSSYEFWDFSWHEIGIYDLPAMITYVTKKTKQKVIYIGHSMGTTTFFVMAITRPDIASKVKLMMALAPVSYLDHGTSPIKILAPYTKQMERLIKIRGTGEFFSQSSAAKKLLKYVCTTSWVQKKICTTLLFFSTNYNSGLFDYALLPDILYHVPAGTSMKVLIHYFQLFNTGRFQYYDYGAEKNLELYNSTESPEYNLAKVLVPVALIWSANDVFTNPIDVTRLYELLPYVVLNHLVPYPEFHHNDFLFASGAPEHVYTKILSFIKNYKGTDKKRCDLHKK